MIFAEVLPFLFQTLKQFFLILASTFIQFPVALPLMSNVLYCRIQVGTLRWPFKHFNLSIPQIIFYSVGYMFWIIVMLKNKVISVKSSGRRPHLMD